MITFCDKPTVPSSTVLLNSLNVDRQQLWDVMRNVAAGLRSRGIKARAYKGTIKLTGDMPEKPKRRKGKR